MRFIFFAIFLVQNVLAIHSFGSDVYASQNINLQTKVHKAAHGIPYVLNALVSNEIDESELDEEGGADDLYTVVDIPNYIYSFNTQYKLINACYNHYSSSSKFKEQLPIYLRNCVFRI